MSKQQVKRNDTFQTTDELKHVWSNKFYYLNLFLLGVATNPLNNIMNHTPAQPGRRKIFDLSLELMDPLGAERAMTKSIESKLKVQSKIIFKDQMMCLKKVGSDEVQSLAMKITKKIRFNKSETAARIINFIMKLKIEDVNQEIEEEKSKVKQNQSTLNKFVRPHTFVAHEFSQYEKEELENTWKKEKEKVKERVVHLRNKNRKRLSNEQSSKIPDIYKGIKVSNNLLIYSDDIPSKVKIHDDVNLDAEQKEALNVLPKDTFYSNITMKDADQQA